jgi:hypothetical protein
LDNSVRIANNASSLDPSFAAIATHVEITMTTGNSRQRARHQLVINEARRMARSGEYTDSKEIETALREADLAESLDAIGEPDIREELDNLCHQSRAAKR